jgi:hypothetical protein
MEYIDYTRGMSFEQEPDYNYLRGLFRSVLDAQGSTFDYIYDWVKRSDAYKQKEITIEDKKDTFIVKDTAKDQTKHLEIIKEENQKSK